MSNEASDEHKAKALALIAAADRAAAPLLAHPDLIVAAARSQQIKALCALAGAHLSVSMMEAEMLP